MTGRTFAANRAHGQIAIIGQDRGGRTHAQCRREAGALRVRFPRSTSGELEGVIINSSGGICGGDRFDIRIGLEPNARLILTSAAAEKIYRSLGPDAIMNVKFELGPGTAMAWLPQEMIMFDQAKMVRSIEADLAATARVVIAEAVVFGRS